MALPKLTTTKFCINLPSNGELIQFRPFLVKEEKALLIAMESEDEQQMIMTMMDIINNCVEGDNFDVAKIPFFDTEYLFLNLRAKSIGEISTLEYRHTDGINYKGEPCDVSTEIKINLEQIEVQEKEGHTDTIKLNDKLSLKLKYPSIMDISKVSQEEDEPTRDIEILSSAIQYAFDDDEIYEADTEEEKIEFIESMNSAQIQMVAKFFETMPRIKHKVTYKCEGCGQEDTIELEGLSDFF